MHIVRDRVGEEEEEEKVGEEGEEKGGGGEDRKGDRDTGGMGL